MYNAYSYINLNYVKGVSYALLLYNLFTVNLILKGEFTNFENVILNDAPR